MSLSMGRQDFAMASGSRAGEQPATTTAAGSHRVKRRRELSEEQRAEISEAFELFDSNKDGKLDYYELKVALRALGFDVKKLEVQRMLREFDQDGDGLISEDSFRIAVTDRVLDRNPIEEVSKAFKLFDEDGTGMISVANLRRVARELGENMTDDELQAMISEFDSSNKGACRCYHTITSETSAYSPV
eukprot:m.187391 g.187391  ORF g.187391 m.187391 type:complete len:188 (-) comp18505_c1_seq10:851-1414(-)